MARLEILKIGHPSLAKTSARIEVIDDEIRRLAEDMVETMHAAPGIGLSAPQVNINRRLITVDVSIGEQPLSIAPAVSTASHHLIAGSPTSG